jgi:serine phosphatase RsbU (regulator of sigma subunit)
VNEHPTATRPVVEGAGAVIAAIERLSRTPLLLADAAGDIVAASPGAASTCAAASAGLGGRHCSHSGCPRHPSFAVLPLGHAGLCLVHCGGPEAAQVAAGLVNAALDAEAEKAALAGERQELRLLQKMSGALEEEIDHLSAFQHLLQSLAETLPFSHAEIWVHHPADGEFRALVFEKDHAPRLRREAIPSDAGLEGALRAPGPRLLRVAPAPSGPDGLLGTMLESLGTPAVIVPLWMRSKLLGVLLLRVASGVEVLDGSTLRVLAAAGRQTSLVLQVHVLIEELRKSEGFRREMEIARRIQQSLLPQEIPENASYDLFGGCVAAAQVGGDFYDFVTSASGELGMVVADVSGHSIASGLVAMSFRGSFKHFLKENHLEPGELFTGVNRALHAELSRADHFLSAVYGTFNPRTRRFLYVNAGHQPPLILDSRTRSFRTLDETGLLLGVLPEWKYEAAQTVLQPGETLLLYTDGIVEAENQHGEQFGLERLKEAMEKHAQKSAKEMYHYLLKEQYLFQDEEFNRDDVTLVILKVR